MSDILLTENGWDIDIVDGDLVFIEDKEILARQSVLLTMRTYKGEWFKNIGYGIPWITNSNNPVQILGKTQKTVFDSYIRNGILSNEEVISIISYTSSVDPYTGKITIETFLEIESGTITITEEI